MVVEPESLCWLTGRLVEARDGVTWAEEFGDFSPNATEDVPVGNPFCS
jgi:hypothetical protein